MFNCFDMFHRLLGRSTIFLEDIGGCLAEEFFLVFQFLPINPTFLMQINKSLSSG